jgi:DinB superfamily
MPHPHREADSVTALAPPRDEYDPYYASYINRIARGEDVLNVLEDQLRSTSALFLGVEESRGSFRYAPGKWSIKEVIGHLTDAERIMSDRALRIGRGDPTPLPGFDENAYVPAMEADARAVADLVSEWSAVRRATVALFQGLPRAAWARRGVANGSVVSVRALAYIVAGHERHHLETLRNRYRLEG